MSSMIKSIFRPFRHGSTRSMLHARSSGHYIADSGWRDRRLQKSFLELFWCICGEGEFCCMDDRWILNAGEVCFYLPGDVHEISALSGPFEYYWFTVDGPDLPRLIRMFGIERRPRNAGVCPVSQFERLMGELRDCSPSGEYRAGAAAYEILSLAFAGTSNESNRTVREFRTFVEDHFQEPEVNIESFASAQGIHRSTLTRLVRRHCGISPVEYLISFRMQEALRLLYDTGYTIKEIAECCGFRDQNYFSKAVQLRFGKNPTELRRNR